MSYMLNNVILYINKKNQKFLIKRDNKGDFQRFNERLEEVISKSVYGKEIVAYDLTIKCKMSKYYVNEVYEGLNNLDTKIEQIDELKKKG